MTVVYCLVSAYFGLVIGILATVLVSVDEYMGEG